MSYRRIDIVIDELNLGGIEPRQRERVVLSLERELGRLYLDYPPRSGRSSVDRVSTRPVQLTPRTSGAMLGAQVAERVYGATLPPQRKS